MCITLFYMRILLLILTYLFHCSSDSDKTKLTGDGFTDYTNQPLDPEVFIGGLKYTTFDKTTRTFCFENPCRTNSDVSYPMGLYYPVFPILDILQLGFRVMGGENTVQKNNNRIEIEKVINTTTMDNQFKVKFALAWIDTKNEVLLVWNASRTYMIISVFDNTVIKDYTISLGRGIETVILATDLKRKKRTIYEISSHKMIMTGCLEIEGLIDKGLSKFSMFPSYLSNLGGELVTFQGPCFKDRIIVEMEIYNKENQLIQRKTSASVSEKSNQSLQFKMPFMWHAGVYVFKFLYNEVSFESEAEIYTWSEYKSGQSMKWDGSTEMNNPKFQLPSITLHVDTESNYVNLNILNVSDIDVNYIPNVITHNTKPYMLKNEILIQLNDISELTFDVNKSIGYFSAGQGLDEKVWSDPFSLIWLQSKRNYFTEMTCESILTQKKNVFLSYCPDNVKKAKLMLSVFQQVTSTTDFYFEEISSFDCYVQITPIQTSDTNLSNGRTCCYSTKGDLVYGQDYYLRSKSRFGSYGWKYSPITNAYQHFIYDRLPIMTCCTLIINNASCSKYWEQYNIVHSSDYNADYAGNVFGDPHVMTFNSQIKYSFLSRGEYWLMKGSNKLFGLQGRFYSAKPYESTLKGIAFNLNSNKVRISTKRNIVTRLNWAVTFNDKIVYLPYKNDGITIVQSPDTQKLFIYILISGKYYIRMDLTRLSYVTGVEEYMNLNVFVSNNVVDIVNGGLFGRLETGSNNSNLYFINNTKIRQNAKDEDYFQFCKSWQIENKGDSLFSYVDDIKEYSNINMYENFTDLNSSPTNECDENVFCNIDKHFYPNGNFSQITKAVYNKRMLYNNKTLDATFGKRRMCDHPQFKFIILDSDNYLEGSVIKVLGCIDQAIKLEDKNLQIRCVNASAPWLMEPPMDDDLCKFTPKPSAVVNANSATLVISIVVPLVLLLVLGAAAAALILYRRRQKTQQTSLNNSEMKAISQDPLQGSNSVPIDDTYDTWQPNKSEQDDYGVYSQIKKPVGDQK